ncbi:MAG: type II toxin-antitoxin system Phd/YefM family antitoxin [Deltaproteobacteria bacterium]|nr:type II toxin-antitoxin system Phd/YefM family antitoxin [Deltaproteobacteria bacterium]
MPRAPKITPISNLRQNASDVIRSVSSSREPVFITQRGKAAAVSFHEKAERTLSRLAKFPESGRWLPEFPDLPFREVIRKPGQRAYSKKPVCGELGLASNLISFVQLWV